MGKAQMVTLLLLGAAVPSVFAQATLSEGAMIGIAFGIIALFIVGFVVLGLLLLRANRRLEKRSNEHPHFVLRFIKFFFQYAFFELLTVPFAVAGIVQLQDPSSLGPVFDPTLGVKVAYYVFLALQYAVCIFIGLMENVGLYRMDPNAQEQVIRARWAKIGYKLHLPPTWITLVEGAIFLPLLILDGMINNGQAITTGVFATQLFPYDVVVLTCIEACLYIKLNLFYVLDTHGPTTTTGRGYSIPDIMYQMVLVVVTLSYLFLFVVYHLVLAPTVGFTLTRQPLLIVMIVIVLMHNTTASFTSMLYQGIIHRSRALYGSDAKSKQLQLYIYWFKRSPLWMIINLAVYGWQLGIYVIVILTAGLTLNVGGQANPAIRAMVVIVSIMCIVLTSWLLVNLIYGALKRLGSYFPRCFCGFNSGVLPCFACLHFWWLPPIAFNCSSYMSALGTAGVNFTM